MILITSIKQWWDCPHLYDRILSMSNAIFLFNHPLDWMLTYLVPSHYLNQFSIIVNWPLRNKLQWNFNQNTNIFIHKNASETIAYKVVAILSRGRWDKSLWPNHTIWRQRSGSTLAQVMACCLTAPSHYLNQCWPIVSKVQWHSY